MAAWKEEDEELWWPAWASADPNINFSVLERCMNCGDGSFSDMCHSDEEYFKKVEELKAAHIETMAKLEKMYQNKLVQPVTIREDVPSNSSSSVLENNYCHPVMLMTSLLEPDLGYL